jgi:hypothetical protein
MEDGHCIRAFSPNDANYNTYNPAIDEYNKQLAAAQKQDFINGTRNLVKSVSGITPRPSEDLHGEKRHTVFRPGKCRHLIQTHNKVSWRRFSCARSSNPPVSRLWNYLSHLRHANPWKATALRGASPSPERVRNHGRATSQGLPSAAQPSFLPFHR